MITIKISISFKVEEAATAELALDMWLDISIDCLERDNAKKTRHCCCTVVIRAGEFWHSRSGQRGARPGLAVRMRMPRTHCANRAIDIYL